MAGKKKKEQAPNPTIAQNRKARFDYELLEEWEAGIILTGTEVKSLRAGKANIAESYVEEKDGAAWLVNADIPCYSKASDKMNHEPRRIRKLLLHQKEINKIAGATQQKGLTVVPLSLYFNKRGIAKLKIALARGKTKYDKRETTKKREWQVEKGRILKENK